LICWEKVERSLDLKMGDKNKGIDTAYIMALEMEERKS
jgi:hypothetical protein